MISSYEWHTLHPRYLREGSVVLDLGANCGRFSHRLIREFGAFCHAVEPSPDVFAAIPEHQKLRKYPLAIGGYTGTVRFRIDHDSPYCSRVRDDSVGHADTIEVEQFALPDFVTRYGIRRIDVLKSDIEAAEIAMLDVTPDELLASIGQLTIEFHDFCGLVPSSEVRRVLARLHRLGFWSIRMSRVGHQDTWCVNRRTCPITRAEMLFTRYWMRNLLGAFRVMKRGMGLELTERAFDFRRRQRPPGASP